MLTLQVLPYSEIGNLTSVGKIRKLLNIAKENKIILLQGRLSKEEEAELIKATMEEINKDFKGIELAVLESEKSKTNALTAFRDGIANVLLGNKQGLTIIGPANIVKEIKKDPKKIELLTKDIRTTKKKNKKK
ncbi:hypothetical protein CEE44_03250 [Candidatus Woesearchaeota archaeon B3_Woes]|nr:MAG: hypothetical protein CEE44_03250 [Candidatus Woesearchaeota archaeon B3_Woes]